MDSRTSPSASSLSPVLRLDAGMWATQLAEYLPHSRKRCAEPDQPRPDRRAHHGPRRARCELIRGTGSGARARGRHGRVAGSAGSRPITRSIEIAPGPRVRRNSRIEPQTGAPARPRDTRRAGWS
jgi:hypothetical protein